MEVTKVKMVLESVAPVLYDRFSGINDANDEEARKNAVHKLYVDNEGWLMIPVDWLKAAIREASSAIGKKTESKKRRQAIRAGLFFDGEGFRLQPEKKEPDLIYAKPVKRGQGAKQTTVVSYRPCVTEWRIDGAATLFGLTPDFVRQCVERAGLVQGVGGYRPEFGRFRVVSFEEVT